MQRNNGVLLATMCLISCVAVAQPNSLTDCYYCLSFSSAKPNLAASVVGYVAKSDILANKVGIFMPKENRPHLSQ
ncbi:MAG: hypothetical protein IPN94_10765 [Sphingobacteriales bacterium]|nr:hypothetical protein [Sphingobacteriales bacterium]